MWRLVVLAGFSVMACMDKAPIFYSGDRPRVPDATAEQVLQRIAQGISSDLNLSESNHDTIVDPNLSAPLQSMSSDEDESGDDGPSTSSSKSAKLSWKRHQG